MGLADVIGTAVDVFKDIAPFLPGIIHGPSRGPEQFPFPRLPGNGGAGLGFNFPSFDLPMIDIGAQGACAGFRPGVARQRPIREIRAVNPSDGKIHSWTHRGSPLIWSGDRAIAKRYAKTAGFTLKRRGSPGRARRRR